MITAFLTIIFFLVY